ncbi:DUF441 domain-containing protein [Candidatus Desulforudis audaxviator]|uniref:UPF0756 membrane protein Daud_1310 n=1 Tax=Desulforudis audaxviator (strain MP104C) TaxID=477974 RepID=Y1310_DESAP|nr:DUF441 domain-containing protein [Candidatus Desulforudis audaxviator]B1I4G8.1 RecName: Full=UPF0756 membrane protein Daud_1310 [Candidatus Desulforudis audaxviator MP104C]ACA59821.1 protein of unknown function DUF441 [Candidatus Desulforudis audaxviator MP104C]
MPVTSELILAALLLVGVLAKSHLIAAAACILLFIKLARFDLAFNFLEQKGLELGLLILLLTIMVPLANGKISERDIIYNLTSIPGLLAILGGALATHLNSQGLQMMQADPAIIFGLIIGSIFGILFLGGMPVGPLMAAGIAALFMEFFKYTK